LAVSGSLVTTTMSLEGSVHITCPHCQCSFKVPPLDRVMTAQSAPKVILTPSDSEEDQPLFPTQNNCTKRGHQDSPSRNCTVCMSYWDTVDASLRPASLLTPGFRSSANATAVTNDCWIADAIISGPTDMISDQAALQEALEGTLTRLLGLGDDAPSEPAMKQSRRDEDPPPPPGPPPAVVLQPPVPVSTGGDEQNPWESVPSVALQPPVPVSSGAESSTPCTNASTAADYVGYFKNPDAMFECETCNRAFAEEFFCWQHVLSREQCHQQPRTAAAVQAWVGGTVGHGWISGRSKKK